MSELPPGWTLATVADLIAQDGIFSDGDWIESKDQDPAGAIRLLQLADIGDGTFVDKSNRFINDEKFQQLRCTEVFEGDILIARMPDPLGRACLAPKLRQRCITVVDVAIVRPGADSVRPKWLIHFLNAPPIRQLIELQSSGTTRRRISRGNLAQLELPVPPLSEQKRIADRLDALLARVDACHERLDHVPSILKRFRQAVLAAATSGELTREWREERGCTRDWLESRIEEIAAVGTGSTPLRSNTSFYSNTGTPWITSAATGLPFVTQAEEFVTDAAIAAHRLKKYPVGTLLVAMYGEGKTRGQVTELRIEATINQACAAIVVNESKATRAFVKLALESNYLEMRELAEGGNQPNLNLTKIKEFPLSLPPLDEQRVIAERVEAIGSWIRSVEARVRAAQLSIERLRPATLAMAFRGELVPQDPDDEPASELLARIRNRPESPGKTSKPKRDGTRALRTKTKAEINMLTRKDVTPTHLTTILKERGALTAEALWTASQLEIDDFYDQLKDEEARGLLRENRGDTVSALRLLEPAA
ncbi:restriction endonuclease subunit S [Myxococcus faecalis]|uniref:restriction endonuclease subunit S n=1 Tax=Myxococcus faecalis TaxID=3115646 RepID=UPI0038CF380C